MTWSTSEIEHEGFPLLLRRPNHLNIWEFKDRFHQLITVEHHLEKTTDDGLPVSPYNKTLIDFDDYMCCLFDNSNDGIIILIETFGGKRNYYYYTETPFDLNPFVEEAKKRFRVALTTCIKLDYGWQFLDTYPVELYGK